MKAVVAERFGGLDALAVVERSEPVVDGNDVLIEVKAASLNPIDFKIREGKLKLVMAARPPIALGCDVAGVVSATGGDVRGIDVGDEVFARLEKGRMGGLAERVAADASVVAPMP
jgi:NADPH:quinone reductase-like Zn-dependent oxidoreductase